MRRVNAISCASTDSKIRGGILLTFCRAVRYRREKKCVETNKFVYTSTTKLRRQQKKFLSTNAIFEDGVDSIFYQFANTVTASLAFAIIDPCMGAGLG